MNRTRVFKRAVIAIAALGVNASVAYAEDDDFGVRVEQLLKAQVRETIWS